MPNRAENRSGGWTDGWEPKGWRAIEVVLVGETYAINVQDVILLYHCVEGEVRGRLYFMTGWVKISRR
jgi:hypothetical protein